MGNPISRREAESLIRGTGKVRRKAAEDIIEVTSGNGAHDLHAKRRRDQVAEQESNYNRRAAAQARFLNVTDQLEYQHRRRVMKDMSVDELEYYSQPQEGTT